MFNIFVYSYRICSINHLQNVKNFIRKGIDGTYKIMNEEKSIKQKNLHQTHVWGKIIQNSNIEENNYMNLAFGMLICILCVGKCDRNNY